MPASKTATLKGLLERRPSLNPRKNVKTLKDSADSGSSFGPSGRLSGPCRLGLMGEALDLEVLYRSKTPKPDLSFSNFQERSEACVAPASEP